MVYMVVFWNATIINELQIGVKLRHPLSMAFSQLFSAQVFAGNNSVATRYPVTFPIVAKDNISVAIRATGATVDTVLVPNQFTVHPETGGGWSVSTAVAYPGTTAVTIFRRIPYDQPFEFPEGGAFPTREVERCFDRIEMQIQQLARETGVAETSIVVPGGNPTTVLALKVLANAGARALAVPDYFGQLAVQMAPSPRSIWIANGSVAGAWEEFSPQIEAPEPVVLPAYKCVALIADSGDTTGGVAPLSTLIEGWNPSELLMAGDNNYGTPGQIATKNAPFAWALAKTYTAEGNHDIDTDSGVANRAYFPAQPSNPAGLPGCYHKVIAGGLIDLIVLTSGRNSSWVQTVSGGVAVGSAMHLWFVALLPTLSAPHRVVMFHHPEFSPAFGSQEVESALAWPWAEYGVSLVINGHNHLTWAGRKRGVLYLNPSSTARRDGVLTPALQGAAAGAHLEFHEAYAYCAMALHVTPQALRYEVWDSSGLFLFGGSAGHASPRFAPDVYVLGDIWAPNEPVTVAVRHADYAPDVFRLDRVEVSRAAGDDLVTYQILIDGVDLFTVAAELSAATDRVDADGLALSRLIPAGARIDVSVLSVTGAYTVATSGLRVNLVGTWITP